MIEPKIHTNQQGVIGQQHGLQKLTTTLAALERGQQDQAQRDTQMQTQLTTLTQQVQAFTTWGRRLLLAIGTLGVLTLGLGAVVVWQVWHPPTPDLPHVKALGALDQAIVQQWGSLPRNVQESLTGVYSRSGLPSPGDRQKR